MSFVILGNNIYFLYTYIIMYLYKTNNLEIEDIYIILFYDRWICWFLTNTYICLSETELIQLIWWSPYSCRGHNSILFYEWIKIHCVYGSFSVPVPLLIEPRLATINMGVVVRVLWEFILEWYICVTWSVYIEEPPSGFHSGYINLYFHQQYIRVLYSMNPSETLPSLKQHFNYFLKDFKQCILT